MLIPGDSTRSVASRSAGAAIARYLVEQLLFLRAAGLEGLVISRRQAESLMRSRPARRRAGGRDGERT